MESLIRAPLTTSNFDSRLTDRTWSFDRSKVMPGPGG
jgi:hypothetical protein